MSKFEVMFGDKYEIIEAGNFWAACITFLQLYLDKKTVLKLDDSERVFLVTHLDSLYGTNMEISLHDVVEILRLNAEFYEH